MRDISLFERKSVSIIIEVFKTNIESIDDASRIKSILLKLLKAERVDFDLEDCDKVLRVEGKNFAAEEVICALNISGFECERLIY